jgi:hypothetical protein
MDNARKYILKISEVISSGISTNYSAIVCRNLMNPFTITCDTDPVTTQTYGTLTCVDLKGISKIDFDRRVIDFLDVQQIESELTKERLFNEASYYDPKYPLQFNLLNDDFFVYKFLDNGVRIVNAGQANGELQYRVSGTSYDSGWQNNATFLSLDYNQTYNFQIRDFYNGVELFKKSKIIDMYLLLVSTTPTLAPKTVKLMLTGQYAATPACGCASYKTGKVCVVPNLIVGECVTVNLIANAITVGTATESCVIFRCNSTTQTYCSIINPNEEKLINLSFGHGDIMCYELRTIYGNLGSEAISNFCLTGADGHRTFQPTIDITNCTVTLTAYNPTKNVIVCLGTPTTMISTPTQCVVCGSIMLSQSIPSGEYLNIGLSGINPVLGDGGTSTTTILCKNYCAANHVVVAIFNTPAPTTNTVNMRFGDSIKYCIALNASGAGYCSCAELELNTVSGSMGLIPSISYNPVESKICEAIIVPKITTVAALRETGGGTNSGGGNLTITPVLAVGQYITVNYNVTQSSVWGGTSTMQFTCKPNGGTSFVNKATHITSSIIGETNTNAFIGSITFNYGDAVQFSNSVYGNNGSCSHVCLTTVTGSIGIDPSVNPLLTKCMHCRCLYSAPVSKTVCLCGAYGGVDLDGYKYETGCFCVLPIMTTPYQSVDISYGGNLLLINAGTVFVNIYCKAGTCGAFILKCTHTMTKAESGPLPSNYSGTIRVCANDYLCYYIGVLNTMSNGTCADLCIKSLSASPDITPIISGTCYKTCVCKP